MTALPLNEILMLLAALVAAGLAGGVIAGLLGVGGGGAVSMFFTYLPLAHGTAKRRQGQGECGDKCLASSEYTYQLKGVQTPQGDLPCAQWLSDTPTHHRRDLTGRYRPPHSGSQGP
ncbi:MAG: hypothetical protein K0M78_04930 [Brevundimonas sp.]|nr:hypothetical protein [Brevundimonas sp.]